MTTPVEDRAARARYRSWGRYPATVERGTELDGPALPSNVLGVAAVLPFGNGRSYGDSCLNPGGTLLDTRRLNRILSLDTKTGRLEAEAGCTLADIIAHAVPTGWFVPVTPGTRFVTLGGAIANDVHGKNHHVRGTFGCHVIGFELVRSSGERLRCNRNENVYLYRATIGGLGLTGLVTRATIQLIPVKGSMIDQEIIRFGRLDEYEALNAESDARFEYSVAWIDQMATGANLGRGLFIRGNHSDEPDRRPFRLGGPKLSVPITPPVSVIARPTLAAFNALYWRQVKPGLTKKRVRLEPFFYPLDAIRGWNRLYGPRGLLQHQSVVPMDAGGNGGMAVIRRLIEESQKAGAGSFLTVLKSFGPAQSPALMSFPRKGLTLTLDYANGGAHVLRLMDRLDTIVVEAGGAINPSKDARMSPATFDASFPTWRDAVAAHDPAFSSAFWRRVTAGM